MLKNEKSHESLTFVPIAGGTASAEQTEKFDPDALLTIDEVAAKLKIKKSFLYAPSRRKGPDAIPCLKIGKYNRYSMPAVMKWIAAQQDRG